MISPGRGRRLAVWAVACALLAVAVSPGLGASTAVEAGSASPVDVPRDAAVQQETPANETLRHEDPDEVDRQGDLSAVERYLAGRLSQRLGEGTVRIGRGEYEAARSVLGDEYDSQLERYVDVAGETEGEADDETADSFREAGNRTRSFANESEQFEETYESYEEASERGEESRARSLARDLVERADDVDRTGDRLQETLQSIENGTGRDLSAGRATVGNVTESTRERADEVAAATFVRTRIRARASPTDVSFLRPATVRGRLVDENGSALANRSVRIGSGTDEVRVETDETGRFEARYRPIRLPADATSIVVEYVPRNSSGYLGNGTTVPISVTPESPTVTAEARPATVAFDDRLTASGSVAVEDVAVPGVPVAASVDGVPVATGETDGAGAYVVSGRLPADVPAGEGRLEVRVDQTGRAVRGGTTTVPLTVETTGTALSVNGSVGDARDVEVAGRLTTDDGTGVDGRTIRLSLDGEPVAAVTTGPDGRFTTTAVLPADGIGDDGVVELAARFDGDGTNLDGSAAEATVAVPAAAGPEGPLGGLQWQWLLVVGGLVLLATGGLVAWRRVRRDRETVDEAVVAGSATRRSEPADPGSEPPPVASGWLADVESLLDGGETDRAVARAYGAVRAQLAGELDVSGALTHWEFYAAAGEDGVEAERVEALLALTEAYERARFAPTSTSVGEAEAAVDSAGDVLSG